MDIERMRLEALKSPCKVIKFSASDGEIFSYNGEFYANCENCKRTEVEQTYPDCKANHAEWGILAKSKKAEITDDSRTLYDTTLSNTIYIYCMTPDKKDYPFKRFWCQTCAVLIPMFGIKHIFMWNGSAWELHRPEQLILEANHESGENNIK